MPYTEEEFVAISALQHHVFCPRQAALIHVERIWVENRETMEGVLLHRRVDEPQERNDRRGDLVTARGIRIHSHRLGLAGRADVVEFRRRIESDETTTRLDRHVGYWRPRPVEYKRGRPKKHRADEVQLCAQALCLEEMLGVVINDGDLFYGVSRRRMVVEFGDELRNLVESTLVALRATLSASELPKAEPGPKCRRCSLVETCLPEATAISTAASDYLSRWIDDVLGIDE